MGKLEGTMELLLAILAEHFFEEFPNENVPQDANLGASVQLTIKRKSYVLGVDFKNVSSKFIYQYFYKI